ncbi:propanediol diffusion facilitator [Klebsiella grimontii]|uniref:Propanediol diffusion facilitator n=1 Tax=Klebsiella grimontii TaxID=2058152 RepID=A0A7H4NXN4_9ENTR|nr:propanediol diffusion facilitator [Klebsiella grimontii]
MLMGMIMALTDDGNGVPKGPLAPLLIGLLVAVIGASTGPLTGFAMNPARDFGPKLFTWMAGWGDIAMTGGRDIPVFYRTDYCAADRRLPRRGDLSLSDRE